MCFVIADNSCVCSLLKAQGQQETMGFKRLCGGGGEGGGGVWWERPCEYKLPNFHA